MEKKLKGLLALTLSYALLFSITIFPVAAADTSHTRNTSDMAQETIAIIEDELQANGTNIQRVLTELMTNYDNLSRSAETKEEQQQCAFLAESLQTIIDDYNECSACLRDSSIIDAAEEAYLKTAVAAVITWFTGHGLNLAAELLITARENTDEDMVYLPFNKSGILYSPVVSELIKKGRPSGSGEFPSDGDRDLYYAIHLFNYRRTNQTFVLTDVYDYELGDQSYPDSITDIAVDTMARAQLAGIIVPYTVRLPIKI